MEYSYSNNAHVTTMNYYFGYNNSSLLIYIFSLIFLIIVVSFLSTSGNEKYNILVWVVLVIVILVYSIHFTLLVNNRASNMNLNLKDTIKDEVCGDLLNKKMTNILNNINGSLMNDMEYETINELDKLVKTQPGLKKWIEALNQLKTRTVTNSILYKIYEFLEYVKKIDSSFVNPYTLPSDDDSKNIVEYNNILLIDTINKNRDFPVFSDLDSKLLNVYSLKRYASQQLVYEHITIKFNNNKMVLVYYKDTLLFGKYDDIIIHNGMFYIDGYLYNGHLLYYYPRNTFDPILLDDHVFNFDSESLTINIDGRLLNISGIINSYA